MGNRGMDAPLAVQMDRLKKSINKRDKRRDQDRQQRLVSLSKDDPYAQLAENKASGGGLRSDQAAQAAVLNAAALEGPAQIQCQLCQATFRSEAMLRQHEEGPAHKKALAREKARIERETWQGNPSAASNALQAAAWLGGSERRTWQSVKPNAVPSQPKEVKPPRPIEQEPKKEKGMSHADRIASAHRSEEPLNINGWVPPSLGIFEPKSQELEEDEDKAGIDQNDADLMKEGSQSSGSHEEQKSNNTLARESISVKKESKGLGLDYGDSSVDDDSGGSEDDESAQKLDSFF